MLLVGAAATFTGPSSNGPTLDDSHKAAAQKLFDDGRRLIGEGRVEEACRDFAESQRLDPAIGTRFNLADCYEQLGKLASAWVHFVGVADAADRMGQSERAAVARERADALEPRLATLQIDVPDPLPGLVVTRDGSEVGAALWSNAVPVDRGAHTIEARAPGHVVWSDEIDIALDGATAIVRVPALAPVEPEPPPPSAAPVARDAPPRTPEPRPTLSRPQIAGLATIGAGVVLLGVGGAFGIVAKQKHDQAKLRCPRPQACFADGAGLTEDARRLANASTVTFVAGGIIAVAGIVTVAVTSARKRKRGTSRAALGPRGLSARF